MTVKNTQFFLNLKQTVIRYNNEEMAKDPETIKAKKSKSDAKAYLDKKNADELKKIC